MLKVKCIQCNMLQENCYIVSDEATREAAIIDCGAYYEAEWQAIVRYISEQKLTVVRLLCTHGHFDHVMGCPKVKAAYGLHPDIHPDDKFLIDSVSEHMKLMLGVPLSGDMPQAGQWLADGDTVALGQSTLKVLHTPGHSPGSVIFYSEADQLAFTGDTLFRMSVGRTDLDGGSWSQLMQSLSTVVAQLPSATVVLPGHGPRSVISDELRMNPYLNKNNW